MAIAAMRVHQIQGAQVEAIQYMNYKTAAAIVIGSVLIDDTGEVDVAGADPTSIVGLALQAADTSPGYDAANSPATITGREQKISVCRPNDTIIFAAKLTNNSSAVIAPVAADRNAQYGITAYSGAWTVDKNKTGASARVTIVGIDEDNEWVFFKFIASSLL